MSRIRFFCLWAVLAMAAMPFVPAQAQTANPFKKPPVTVSPGATGEAKPLAKPESPAKAEAPAKAELPTKPAVDKVPSQAQLASRARMKDCGSEWQELKAAGKSKGKTWRSFSSECLKQR